MEREIELYRFPKCGSGTVKFANEGAINYSTCSAMGQAARDKFSKLVSEDGVEFERFKKKYKLKRLEV